MKKILGKNKNVIIRHLKYLLIVYISLAIIFMVLFHNENFFNVLGIVSSLFFIFIVPGFFIMYWYSNKLDFVTRLIIGSLVGFALVGILSYNIGLIGIHVKYHAVIIPILLILIGSYSLYKNEIKA